MSSEGYDVLRLIEHNSSCYVSSEFVQGRSLVQWLKYHPDIPKEQLLSWMYEIMRQLGLFHRLRGRPCYQYVNPYSIIISGEEKLYLLDAGSQSSESAIGKMHRRAVRENFLPPEENTYRKASTGLDIYGLGRTWQYMLSVTEPDPALTRREERRFKKVISRCLDRQSKHTYQNIEDIQKYFPKSRSKRFYLKIPKRALVIAAVFIIAAAGIKLWKPFRNSGSGEGLKKDAPKDTYGENTEKKDDSADTLLKFDMGMVCLLELKEYTKAVGYLEETDRYGADCYAMIARCMEKGTAVVGEQQLAAAMELAEGEMPKGREPDCIRALVKGYALLDTREADADIIRLGDAYLDFEEKEGGQGDAQEEIMELMAISYERIQKEAEAATMYEKILEDEDETDKREELYKKMTLLWEEAGDMEKSLECCRRGIEELQESSGLRLLHIRMQCSDASVDRKICAETIKEYITHMPKLAETEEFKKLQREHDIRVEGEEVWVGR